MPNQRTYLDFICPANQITVMLLRNRYNTRLKIKNALESKFVLPLYPQRKKKVRSTMQTKSKTTIAKSVSNSKNIIKANTKRQKKVSRPLKKKIIKKGIGILFSRVSGLGIKKRLALRKQYPRLASYIFMSVTDKRNYFANKNDEYWKKIMSRKRERESKVQFTTTSQVVLFDRQQPVEMLSESQIIKEDINMTETFDSRALRRRRKYLTKFFI